jgi:hypothetical protein
LWGPSRCRNEVDPLYADPDRWDLAEDNLLTYGREWCRFLFGAERESQAFIALLKWFDDVKYAYGPFPEGHGNALTPRVVLQTIGTEFGRSIDDNVWIGATIAIAKKVLTGGYVYSRDNGCVDLAAFIEQHADGTGSTALARVDRGGVVIPDCRFRNEVDGVQAAGGRIIRVKRPGAEKVVVGVAGHASEAEQDTIPDTDCDHVIVSPEGLANLGAALTVILPNIVRSLK